MNGEKVVRWRCVMPNTIQDVLLHRPNWTETKSQTDWDFFWCGRDWMNNNFLKHSFRENQKVCHFRNGYELCRKDNLVRNVKKMKRQAEHDGDSSSFQFIPASYVLPQDYHLFVEDFRHHPPDTLWIMKPVSGAQGRGIFLFRKLKDITEWKKKDALSKGDVENYLVQSYISEPYLIGGRKFDVRLYVLVTSFQPVRAWLHREGFARFSHTRYDLSSIHDAFVHLTNVAISKTAPDYDPEIGLKWSLDKLRRYLVARHGLEIVGNLWKALGEVLVESLRAVERLIIKDKHCFELYGYDILMDQNLRPWLLEVNASPSLTASNQEDYNMKYRVLSHTLDIIDMEKRLNGEERQVGGFDLILDGEPLLSPVQHQDFFQQTLNVHLGSPY